MPPADDPEAVLANGSLSLRPSSTRRSASRSLDLGMVDGVEVDAATGLAKVAIELTIVGCPAADADRGRRAGARRSRSTDVTDVEVAVSVMTPEQRTALTERLRGARVSGIAIRSRLADPGVRHHERQGRCRASRPSPRTSPSHSRPAACAWDSSTRTCTGSRSPGCSASPPTRPPPRSATSSCRRSRTG